MCISLWSAYTDSSIIARLTVLYALAESTYDAGGVSLHRRMFGLQRALAAARATHSELSGSNMAGKCPVSSK